MSFLKKFSFILSFCLLAMISASLIFIADQTPAENARAAASDNVHGWAWSENAGWISMNCDNKSCRNAAYSGQQCASDADCGGEASSCFDDCAFRDTNYGVNLDSTSGNLTGYGWSDNAGWIYFGQTGNGFPEEPMHWARLESGTITGWAQIVNLGADGWIKLSGSWPNGVTVTDNIFSGWAWNNNSSGTGIGWINFNCADTDAGGCSGHNYSVYINNTPQAVDLTKTDLTYCVNPGPKYSVKRVKLEWTFQDDPGDSQLAYELIVDDNSNFSSPLISTGKVYTSAPQYIVPDAILAYNTLYYWKVRVWDSHDTASDWALSASYQPAAGFTTYKHEFPDSDFSWTPLNPRALDNVYFTDASAAYGGASINSWLWAFANALPVASTTPNPGPVQFQQSGTNATDLTITDSDGYSCSISQDVTSQMSLPIWKETKPE